MHPGWMSAPSGSSLPLMPFGRFIGHAEAIGCSSLHLLFSTASLSSSSSSSLFFFFSFSFSFASWKVQFGGGAGGGSECYDDRHSFPLLFFPLSFLIFLIFLNGFDFLVSFFGFHPLPHPTLTLFQNENTQQTRQQNKKPTETGGLKWTILFSYIYIYLRNLKQRKTKKQRKEMIIIKHFTQVPCRILLDSKRVHSTPESRSLLIVAIVIIIIITFPMIEYWLDVWEGGRRRRRRRKRRIEMIQSSMRMFQRMFQRMSDVPCLPHLPFFLLKIVKKKERIRSQLFVSHRTLWKEMKNERLKNKNCYL